MKIKLTMNQARLDMWNVPNLRTGDVLAVEPSVDGSAYLIVDTEYNPVFWLAIPKSFGVVINE